ncbi:MAG TPA: hypothetical protein VMW12_03565 [Candidatus Dormibacteraeota bacterium]|nr:hypothetical protein [Candidatus Dormibacteraeota bacterium]
MNALRLAAVRTHGAMRADAMRSLAAYLTEHVPDVLAIHGVDEGDALALATRFEYGWGYRGSEALFWSSAYRARAIHDRYLPAPLLRPFERRGLLCIEGECGGAALALSAVQFSPDRARAHEVRFVREQLRRMDGDALFFAAAFDPRLRLQSLDFTVVAAPDGGEELAIGLRGFAAGTATAEDAAFGGALRLTARR